MNLGCLKKCAKKGLGILGYQIQRIPNDPGPCLPVKAVEERDPLPPILLVTIRKSGTTFIRWALQTGLKLTYSDFRSLSVPQGYGFSDVNSIAAEHVAPDAYNLVGIALHAEKMLFHIRDPRNTCVAIVHHQDRYYKNTNGNQDAHFLSLTGPDWLDLSFEEKIDRAIKTYYPRTLFFLQGWFDALQIDFSDKYYHFLERTEQREYNVHILDGQRIAEGNEFLCGFCPPCQTKVLLSTHEDLVKSGDTNFFNTILDFYGIPRHLFVDPCLEKGVNVQFRTGLTDSWKKEMNAEQQERVTALLPIAWRTYFGWE